MPALSRDERKLLAQATTDWRPLPKGTKGAALTALRALDKVETRVRETGERGQLMVAEWRRVPRGEG